ncbi:hypothetical protein FD04_GL000267 [Secundilactobacillus odoratitofui DSM 19909 = JCM 15043]|uniref:Uncharacterized protein n=1 Tax=Secundilactobacillus odoratitofui DSM 19909 = JCM 15043 TaxID=1423776 RepID=A0A0R1M3T4_9LACO|nr:hypothetical protein FD04_GL000267 [Secundilactobacillus odoratitofui DSM 19909 = JCM 15043]
MNISFHNQKTAQTGSFLMSFWSMLHLTNKVKIVSLNQIGRQQRELFRTKGHS